MPDAGDHPVTTPEQTGLLSLMECKGAGRWLTGSVTLFVTFKRQQARSARGA